MTPTRHGPATSTTRPLGIIGAGFHASTNLFPALRLAGVPIAGVATRSIAGAQAARRDLGTTAPAYGSAAELLSAPEVLDVLVVAQPADQLRLTLQAVAAGVNVLAEKPLGLTGAQARLVARAADEAGVHVGVAFMKRHAPVYQALRSLLESAGLGTTRSFAVAFGCDSTPFCADDREFLTLAAVHLVDLVRYLFGEVAAVSAASSGAGRHVALAVTVTMASGVVGTLDLVGLPGRSDETESVRVDADLGHAETAGLDTLRVHRRSGEESWQTLSERTEVYTPAESAMSGAGRDLHLRGFVGELRSFADAMAAGRQPQSDAWDNVATMDLCDRILASAARPPVDPTLPALAYGPPGPVRDGFVARVLSGRTSGSTSLQLSYHLDGQPVPAPGQRRALLDSSGATVALLEYTDVLLAPMSEVPLSFAAHEASGIEQWRLAQLEHVATLAPAVRAHLGDDSWSPSLDEDVVATTFRVVWRAGSPGG